MRAYTIRDILTTSEIYDVVAWNRSGRRRGQRWRNRLNVFHLATSAGLRASEIRQLDVADVHALINRPFVRVNVGKGHKSRDVPLTWAPADHLADLADHLQFRQACGAGPGDPFICSLDVRGRGNRLDRNQVRRFFISACTPIRGRKRITTHMGRHSFASHALAAGIDPAAVRDALGHSSLAITNLYAHVLGDDPQNDGVLFKRKTPPASAA